MPEIIAGTDTPLRSREFDLLRQRIAPDVQAAEEAAAKLRARIADGETKINQAREAQVSPAVLEDAGRRLEGLRLALRVQEAWLLIDLSAQLAQGVAAIHAEVAKKERWQPPAGSVLRIVLPGTLNLALDLTDSAYHK